MPRKNTKVSNTPSAVNNEHTVLEKRNFVERDRMDFKKKMQDMFKQYREINKAQNPIITTFNKENLRSYLQNIGSSEKQLRQLSRYLFFRSQAYRRLIVYNANMFCLYARSVIPSSSYSLTKNNNIKKILKSYNDTLDVLDKMNLQMEFYNVYLTCFIEDVYYGIKFMDDTGMMLYKLDPDYCRIAGRYMSGDFMYAVDMSYWRSRQKVLEYLGEPLTSMWNEYQKDTQNNRWQIVPDEYSVCLKFSSDNWNIIVPPFSGLFNQLINLCDVEDVQAVADQQDIYKLVYLPLKTVTGSKTPDEFAISPDFAMEYFSRLVDECFPSYISGGVIPGDKLETISFSDSDKVNDTNKVSKATKSLLNSSGGAQVLNSETISGNYAYKASLISDTEFAISSLLPQTQSWVNRQLSYSVSNASTVKFFPVSVYTKEDYKKALLADGQYGIPTKLAINSFNGFSEKETLAILYLENDILNLTDRMRPLASSYTTSHDGDLQSGKKTVVKKQTTSEVDDDGLTVGTDGTVEE